MKKTVLRYAALSLATAALLVACSEKKPSDSLTETPPTTAAAPTALADVATIEEVSAGIAKALQAGDTTTLSSLLPSGMYICVREGATPFVYQHASAGALMRKHITWLADSLKNSSCTPALAPIPSFDCTGFSRKGCFIGEVKKFDVITRAMRADNKEQLATFSKSDMEAAAKIEAEASHLILFTAGRIALYVARVNSKWQILAADAASYTCDA